MEKFISFKKIMFFYFFIFFICSIFEIQETNKCQNSCLYKNKLITTDKKILFILKKLLISPLYKSYYKIMLIF
jgi:hypothetical protein